MLFHLIYITLAIFIYPCHSTTPVDRSKIDLAQNIRIPIKLGLSIVEKLKAVDKEKSTTSQRKEQKAVVSKATLDSIIEKLEKGSPSDSVDPIHLVSRDATEDKDKLNGTFTIYGRAASFKNRGEIMTKIRLRARMYLSTNPDFTQIKRAKKTRNIVFLEIKIKNPTYLERNGANKYRIRITDQDVLKLFRANPHSPDFDQVLTEIKESALLQKNEKEKVECVFEVIKTLARYKGESGTPESNSGVEFIKPQYVTAYTRSSYSFIEKNYPVPTVKEKKKGLFSIFSKNKEVIEYTPTDIEYQLTIDDHVTAFLPLIYPEDTTIEVERYFSDNSNGIKVHYPTDSRTVEIKEPSIVGSLRKPFRTKTHQFIQEQVTDQLQRSLLPGFTFNRGKSGHLSEKLSKALNDEAQDTEIQEKFILPNGQIVIFHY